MSGCNCTAHSGVLESSLTRTAWLLLARAVPVVSYTSLAFLAVRSPDIFTWITNIFQCPRIIEMLGIIILFRSTANVNGNHFWVGEKYQLFIIVCYYQLLISAKWTFILSIRSPLFHCPILDENKNLKKFKYYHMVPLSSVPWDHPTHHATIERMCGACCSVLSLEMCGLCFTIAQHSHLHTDNE